MADRVPFVPVDDAAHRMEPVEHRLRAHEDGIVQLCGGQQASQFHFSFWESGQSSRRKGVKRRWCSRLGNGPFNLGSFVAASSKARRSISASWRCSSLSKQEAKSTSVRRALAICWELRQRGK